MPHPLEPIGGLKSVVKIKHLPLKSIDRRGISPKHHTIDIGAGVVDHTTLPLWDELTGEFEFGVTRRSFGHFQSEDEELNTHFRFDPTIQRSRP